MEVIINMESYNESRLMTPEEKEFYRQTVYSIYEQLKSTMDLSLLENIIVTENYIEELFEFQRNNGLSEFVTDNEYGQGAAQVVTVIDETKNEKYYILLKKELVLALIPDELMSNLQSTFKEEDFNQLKHLKNMSINLLYHELSHVHEYNFRNNIKWIKQLEGVSIESQYLSLALSLWQEYFACRHSAATHEYLEDDVEEIKSTTTKIEIRIKKERKKYNCREVSLDDFVKDFNYYIGFILKKMASEHGSLYWFNESRVDLINAIEQLLKDTNIGAVWCELGECLDVLYNTFPNWENKEVFSYAVSVIKKYIELFEIYIKNTPQGIYYDIPVRL